MLETFLEKCSKGFEINTMVDHISKVFGFGFCFEGESYCYFCCLFCLLDFSGLEYSRIINILAAA